MQKEQQIQKSSVAMHKRRPDIVAKIRRCSERLMRRNAEAYRKLATR